MDIIPCALADAPLLAHMNKQLIEDEHSDNPMDTAQLTARMEGFLSGEYRAFFFREDAHIVGYALVKMTCEPLYLRQFFIKREHRRKHLGKTAFGMLLRCLCVERIDLEVLPWNKAGVAFWESCRFREISRSLRYDPAGQSSPF